MSVFRVKLNNVNQGLLDKNPSTASPGSVTGQGLGSQMNPSVQRGVYVMGPNLINRLLIDGSTFTDCNYWKQFAFPAVPYNESFIEVVTDDGGVYSSNDSENVFPKVYNLSIEAGSTYTDEDNIADVLADTGGFAIFAQITNKEASMGQDIKMRLNGITDAIMDLPANSTQVFNAGDLSITKFEFDNSESGATGPVEVQIVLSVRSVCNS
jgi:hypothetical protein